MSAPLLEHDLVDGLRSLLDRAEPGDQLTLVHSSRRSFRWLFPFELALGLSCCVGLAVVFAASDLSDTTGLDRLFVNLVRGPFTRHHQIAVALIGPTGTRAELRGEASSAADAALLRRIVINSTARIARIDESGPLDAHTRWYPGNAGLGAPNLDLGRALSALTAVGVLVEQRAEVLSLQIPIHKRPRSVFRNPFRPLEPGILVLELCGGTLTWRWPNDPRADGELVLRSTRYGRSMFPWEGVRQGGDHLWLLGPEDEQILRWTSEGDSVGPQVAKVLRAAISQQSTG